MASDDKIDLTGKSILFLGFGAVAKCVWHYLDQFFLFSPARVHAVDQFPAAFAGPRVDQVQQHVLVVGPATFAPLLDRLGFSAGDLVIDLTYDSATYHFLQTCLERGLYYINTSIEDKADAMGWCVH